MKEQRNVMKQHRNVNKSQSNACVFDETCKRAKRKRKTRFALKTG